MGEAKDVIVAPLGPRDRPLWTSCAHAGLSSALNALKCKNNVVQGP